jgi:DNA polymerase III sliding clamp (beta) subunit (PCNA family)
MLDALKFVQGAVALKGLSPELTHFRIENNTIKGFNGSLSLCSPIDLDLNVTPKAKPFIKAITSCRATTAMSITKAGRLSIKSGKFKAFIECIEEVFPDIMPEGKTIRLTGSFVGTLRQLAPYMAQDASRTWARGIMLRGQCAYVTNNIIIIQAWMKTKFPVEVNIPAQAIKELIRIRAEPTHIQVSKRSITFHYEDCRWLRTNLSEENWPDVSKILDIESNPTPITENFFEALEDVKAFADETRRVYFTEESITTSLQEGIGASYSIEGLPTGAYNIDQLLLLKDLVSKVDFNLYPNPCPFFKGNMRGAIVGMINK